VSDYHINVFFSEDDGGYIADISDLESCSAFGETPAQAVAEVLRAKPPTSAEFTAQAHVEDGSWAPGTGARNAGYQSWCRRRQGGV
jgi:hypothetical protein